MYANDDPRTVLQPAKPSTSSPRTEAFFGSQLGLFYETAPQIETATERTWITRGKNFIVAYSEVTKGCVLSRADQPDEYALILPDTELSVTITAGETVEIPGHSIAFIPPGTSEIRAAGRGRLVRLFSPQTEDMAALAANGEAFIGTHPDVPPFAPWPAPPGGFRIRQYSLDVPKEEGRFGRIFRCTTFMINYLELRLGPRARTAVSPHHHEDFEQCSLALSGRFTHHLRWPWSTDMTKWKPDEHLEVGAPSICVIPPHSVHTTTAEDQGENQLVDIFAPPRMDFSKKPGWVLNADDYPMPGE